MEQEFKPQVEQVKVDPSSIKQQYVQMNETAQAQMNPQSQMSEGEIKRRMKEEEKRMNDMLPYYRKQKELLELEIAITTMEVRMGKTPATAVPGIIGKELEIEDIQTKIQWAQTKLQQNNFNNEILKQKEELEKAQKEQQSANNSTATSEQTETK